MESICGRKWVIEGWSAYQIPKAPFGAIRRKLQEMRAGCEAFGWFFFVLPFFLYIFFDFFNIFFFIDQRTEHTSSFHNKVFTLFVAYDFARFLFKFNL